MKMTKRVLLAAALLSCAGCLACGDGAVLDFNFEELCKASGGTSKSDYVCECGDKACEPGVVCIHGVCGSQADVVIWCSPGDKKCDGDGFKTCGEDNKWGESDKACQSFGCANDKACKECADSSKKCENGKYQICILGQWSGEENQFDCPNGAECLEDGSGCKECAEGDSRCDENGISYCIGGEWGSPEACKNCTPDGKQCASCVDGAKRCDYGVLQVCSGGKFVETKKCECLPDRSDCVECSKNICATEDSYRKCTDKKWDGVEKCPSNAQYCTDGQCSSDKKCNEGEKLCKDGRISTCQDNHWESAEKSCEFGCIPNGNECAQCTENECSNSEWKICNGGKYEKSIPCKDSSGEQEVSCSGNKCGGCLDDQIKCNDGQLFTCKNGAWGEGTPCAGGFGCKSAMECGNCNNGDEKCKDGVNHIGRYQVCSNNAYTTIDCPGGYSCNKEGTGCGVCTNNATKCENNREYLCSAGAWTHPKDCTKGCNADGTACETECSDGEHKCVNDVNDNGIGKKMICKNGSWNIEGDCGANSCNGNVCGECHDGDKICEENENNKIGGVMNCKDGKKVDNQVCEGENGEYVSCNADKTDCGVCKNGTQICNNNEIQTCINGDWKTLKICNSNEQCVNNSGQPVCTPLSLNQCTNGQMCFTNIESEGELKKIEVRTCIDHSYDKPGSTYANNNGGDIFTKLTIDGLKGIIIKQCDTKNKYIKQDDSYCQSPDCDAYTNGHLCILEPCP